MLVLESMACDCMIMACMAMLQAVKFVVSVIPGAVEFGCVADVGAVSSLIIAPQIAICDCVIKTS